MNWQGVLKKQSQFIRSAFRGLRSARMSLKKQTQLSRIACCVLRSALDSRFRGNDIKAKAALIGVNSCLIKWKLKKQTQFYVNKINVSAYM